MCDEFDGFLSGGNFVKMGWTLAFGVAIGLLGAGIILLVSRPTKGNAITLIPPPSPQPWVIYVSGEVAHPDVYSLPPGSRVRDAILAAGGFTQDADFQTLNLASFLSDGAKIQVPKVHTNMNNEAPQTGQSVESGLVNINTASQEQLDTLPEIGPTLAQRIIAYRTSNGPFSSIEDIQNVSGVGPATFEKIKSLITVTP